jgi:hypothetical protein
MKRFTLALTLCLTLCLALSPITTHAGQSAADRSSDIVAVITQPVTADITRADVVRHTKADTIETSAHATCPSPKPHPDAKCLTLVPNNSSYHVISGIPKLLKPNADEVLARRRVGFSGSTPPSDASARRYLRRDRFNSDWEFRFSESVSLITQATGAASEVVTESLSRRHRFTKQHRANVAQRLGRSWLCF